MNEDFDFTPVQVYLPKALWEWDVFGGGILIVQMPNNPPWWRILLTKIFLGSKWKKVE